ncbi:hypothetical protein IV203_006128 [Nitzschia inconspicua]|uniref:Uncharacterized protein n=1 Tax=Nitzschia inconspicua TaxID=303405 RepID=A0A9K3KNV1_9STRA|nr:hypothetical protein IV203_006128 [Nitzschia inconspicua]
MFQQLLSFKRRLEPGPPASSIDVAAIPKQDKKMIRSRESGPRRTQIEGVPNCSGARKTPTRKLPTKSHQKKKSENRIAAVGLSIPNVQTTDKDRHIMVTPTSSPHHSPGAKASRKITEQHLPPPVSPPFRITLRRKASKPPSKTKSQIIREEVD